MLMELLKEKVFGLLAPRFQIMGYTSKKMYNIWEENCEKIKVRLKSLIFAAPFPRKTSSCSFWRILLA
jgi:hypothetical protein